MWFSSTNFKRVLDQQVCFKSINSHKTCSKKKSSQWIIVVLPLASTKTAIESKARLTRRSASLATTKSTCLSRLIAWWSTIRACQLEAIQLRIWMSLTRTWVEIKVQDKSMILRKLCNKTHPNRWQVIRLSPSSQELQAQPASQVSQTLLVAWWHRCK